MNLLNFDNEGGLMTFQEVLSFMQVAYTDVLGHLAGFIGNNVIISGCEVVAGNISGGVVIINGEVLPFEGGVNTGYMTIQEDVTNMLYQVGGSKPFYVARKMVPAVSGVAVESLIRLSTIKAHYANTSNPHNVTKGQVGLGNLPNAKSDTITLDSSESLATSKAVYDVLRAIKGGTWTGSVGPETIFTITHNNGNANYQVMLTNTTSAPPLFDFVNYGAIVIEKAANTFKVKAGVAMGGPTVLNIDWIIFPK